MRNKLIHRICVLSEEVCYDAHEYTPKEWEAFSNEDLMNLYANLVILNYRDNYENRDKFIREV